MQELLNLLTTKLNQCTPYHAGLKACCPFHDERTPSFFVYYSEKYEAWFFKCHGCEASGSLKKLFRYLQLPHHMLQYYSPSGTLTPREKQPDTLRLDTTKGYPVFHDYFYSRGITHKVCEQFEFKFDFSIPAAVMPVFTENIYMGAIKRNLDPSAAYKYIIEPGMDIADSLWAWDAIDKSLPTVITEGIIDAACWWSMGVQAIALLGKKWQSKLHYLQELKQPMVVPDNKDVSGLQSFYQLAVSLGAKITLIPYPYKDTSEWVTHKKSQDYSLG